MGTTNTCCCFLLRLGFRHRCRLAVDASLALDAAEFPTQFPVLFGSDIVEVLANNSGIPAQEIDAVPVGCIDTHLLHEL